MLKMLSLLANLLLYYWQQEFRALVHFVPQQQIKFVFVFYLPILMVFREILNVPLHKFGIYFAHLYTNFIFFLFSSQKKTNNKKTFELLLFFYFAKINFIFIINIFALLSFFASFACGYFIFFRFSLFLSIFIFLLSYLCDTFIISLFSLLFH